MKVKPLLLAAILAVASCRGAAHRPSVGLMATPPPSGRVIGFDPSVVGLVGAIGDTVYDSAGIISWVKYDTANTAWRPVPVSQMVTGDPSQAPGLQGPVGFVVTMNDGSKSWQKRSASSTDWVSVPTSGGGTVKSAVLPLQITDAGSVQVADGGIQNPAAVQITGGTIAGTTIDGITPTQRLQRQAYLVAVANDAVGVWTTMVAAVPALNALWCTRPLGVIVSGTDGGAMATDDACVGGCITGPSGVVMSTGLSIIQNTAGGNWAFGWEANLSLPTAGVDARIGLANIAGTHAIAIRNTNSIDSTHTVFSITGGAVTNVTASAPVADALWHQYVLTDDTTTIKEWIDGSLGASTTTRTNLTTEAMRSFWFNATFGQEKLHMFCIGYVHP